MGARYPDPEGEAAKEGTASHWVAAEVLQSRGADPFVGRKAPNGVIITEEMVEAAKEYVQAVSEIVGMKTFRHRWVEHSLSVKRVHPTDCWGTPDLWFFDDTTGELHVWDYKYGWGLVEAYENWQLICYAVGALDLVTGGNALGIADQMITVVMHIVQPRPYHSDGSHRTWRVAASNLRGYVNQLEAAASQALGDNPTLQVGSECKYCRARHACPALQQSAMTSVDYIFGATPRDLTPAGMAVELGILRRAKEAIEHRLSGIESAGIEVVRKGGHIPGYGIQYGKGRLKWDKSPGEIFTLGDLLEIDLRATQQPVTPVQARKAGIPDELIDAYASSGSTGMKLIPQDKTLAARVFGGGS